MTSDNLRRWANIIAFVVVLVVNGLANSLPLNNLTTGDIADKFDVFFVPAAYVFSIWGVIYLALLGFTAYQALPAQRENPRLRRLGWLFVLSCAGNVAWIFLWHYEQFPLTLVAMLVLLLSLIAAYLRLDVGRADVSRTEEFLVDVPFAIYLGWVTVATIANVTSVLDFWGWEGGPIAPELWAVVMLAAALVIGAAVAYTRRDVAYLLVFVWAFAGIAVKHSATDLVANGAWVATVVAAILALWALVTRLRPVP